MCKFLIVCPGGVSAKFETQDIWGRNTLLPSRMVLLESVYILKLELCYLREKIKVISGGNIRKYKEFIHI